MKWQKKGLIYSADKGSWWKNKYAMMPTPEYLVNEGVIRIFFGVTDSDNNGRTAYLDVDAYDPSRIVKQPDEILIDIGEAGFFDDSGAIPSSIISYKGKKYLYYVGFQRTSKVPYMLFIGLAIQKRFPIFEKYSEAPIIDRSLINPVSNAAPFVLEDNGILRMWFWLGKKWTTVNQKLYIEAEIWHARSFDGVKWDITESPCITLDRSTEFSVGRPWVIKENGIYKMWYSVRKVDKLYRLGYAESSDGILWDRMDELVGIDVAEDGWDSEMICYPAVIEVEGRKFLFYNGNNNGESGFGFAELVEEDV